MDDRDIYVIRRCFRH